MMWITPSHSPSLSVQDLSTFLHCCISVLIIQSFSKIIWILRDFHLLFLFHWLVLHLILTASKRKIINSDPESFSFCRYIFEIPLILTMLWNPSDKILKCFWLLDSNLVLSLIQPTSSILSVFQTSRCLPAYQSLNGQHQLSIPIPFKYYIFKIKTTPDNLNPAAGTTARCSGFSKTKMVMCFI